VAAPRVEAQLADEPARARRALERVCSGSEPESAPELYSEQFVDHVNTLEYRGLDGVRKSVALYRLIFSGLQIRVEDQVSEGDRVVSRWTATGTNRGRRLAVSGITISRFADGRIVEDWTASDNLDLLRQLGARRLLFLGLDWLRSRLARRRRAR
jgi:predicted ester cyclase